MRPRSLQQAALQIDIARSDKLGVWIVANGRTYFVAYDKAGWLLDPGGRSALNIRLLNGFHLVWPTLGSDLNVDAFTAGR